MVKNNRLENAIELFSDSSAGSGQIYLRELADYFKDIDEYLIKPDIAMLRQLDRMPSFDVYSCRISLRSLDIEVNDEEYLKLSPEKMEALDERIKDFSRPLIQQVFGSDKRALDETADLVGMLRNPDKEEALHRLNLLADELGVTINDIPHFIEDYGDIFLSLAYFKECLDNFVPVINLFLEWLQELKDTWMIRNDRPKEKLLSTVAADLSDISGSITGRFEVFERKTQDFWSDVSAQRFQEVRRFIKEHHVSVGGVLCGISLKMDHWQACFTKQNPGGPQARLEFIISEIVPGLESIRKLEEWAAGK
jgi:hypothetical protein